MTTSERFELALEKLKPSDWERFEKLASAFLAIEFPNLRTMATYSGDGGRDAELFSTNMTVYIQYSIAKDWKKKVKDTVSKIEGRTDSPKILIYVTNLKIGALGDDLKTELASSGLHLDIRDCSWFVERLHSADAREKAGEELAVAIVDPWLEKKGIIGRKQTPLNQDESRAALVFLEMQWRDQDKGKGLTKACFEALVKAALRGSDIENRLSMEEICNRVHSMLPRHSVDQLKNYIESALGRLLKASYVKRHSKDNSFCFSFDYIESVKESAAGIELLRERYVNVLTDRIEKIFSALDAESRYQILQFVLDTIETYLFELGEEFASAVTKNLDVPIHEDRLTSIIYRTISSNISGSVNQIVFFIKDILLYQAQYVSDYIKIACDSNTLLAFLAETPDVQSVTKKLFASGEIWLDTTVLLPLFAERAHLESQRHFSELFKRTYEAGIKLYATPGIIEEIERHFNLCDWCDKSETWKGKVPYVYQRYLLAGKSIGGFKSWSEQFFGHVQPNEDIAEFLHYEFGIEIEGIDRYRLENISEEVNNTVVDYWMSVHEKRRGASGDAIIVKRLAEHDIENYLYVLDQRSQKVGKSMMGFGVWWLTLDVAAPILSEKIKKECREKVFSPIISFDFLLRYLLFGPRRENVKLGNTRVFADTLWLVIPENLKDIAREIRGNQSDLPERVIQRKIRDALNTQRAELGPAHLNGLEEIEKIIESMY